jgi:hypothetical protein
MVIRFFSEFFYSKPTTKETKMVIHTSVNSVQNSGKSTISATVETWNGSSDTVIEIIQNKDLEKNYERHLNRIKAFLLAKMNKKGKK